MLHAQTLSHANTISSDSLRRAGAGGVGVCVNCGALRAGVHRKSRLVVVATLRFYLQSFGNSDLCVCSSGLWKRRKMSKFWGAFTVCQSDGFTRPAEIEPPREKRCLTYLMNFMPAVNVAHGRVPWGWQQQPKLALTDNNHTHYQGIIVPYHSQQCRSCS